MVFFETKIILVHFPLVKGRKSLNSKEGRLQDKSLTIGVRRIDIGDLSLKRTSAIASAQIYHQNNGTCWDPVVTAVQEVMHM